MKNLGYFFHSVAFLILVGITAFIILNFNSLPDIIPTHFNLSGKPDSFSNKNFIFFLMPIGFMIFLTLFFTSKNPESPFLNLPKDIKENKLATFLVLSVINCVFSLIFADLFYESYLVAMSKRTELSGNILYLLGALLLIIILINIFSKKIGKLNIS
ncbi:Protein of unknown function [Halpernia humi]|uniref:DUF1648 domain-containing protein n=1 Tax=Halpernia humi TaxID=493375 RepID=A0A1H5UPN4_9FLAO|nr:Protein of unknown function [Halpernia humi]